MKARLFLVPSILLALLCMSTAVSDATILIKKDLSQLAAEAELIVIAKVGNQSARYAKGTRVIFTYTDLTIERVLKGASDKTMTVAEVGGKVGDITLHVESMPKFREGERVLLFIKKDTLGQQRVHGAIQGKFQVVHNFATHEDLVLFDKGLRYVTNSSFATKGDKSPTQVSLSEFQAKVLELVKEGKKKAAKKGDKK